MPDEVANNEQALRRLCREKDAVIEKLVGAVKVVEWIDFGGSFGVGCPWCGAPARLEHGDACQGQLAIAVAEQLSNEHDLEGS